MQSKMKKLLITALLCFCVNAYAVDDKKESILSEDVLKRLRDVTGSKPDCPKDQTKRYHNCYGTVTFPDGDQYVGEFKDDKIHGQGTYTFPDGDQYVGEFKDDKKHGQGTYTWPNGNKYVGEFKDGKYDGWGKLTLANGTVKEGVWKEDELVKSKETIERDEKIANYKEKLRINPITGIFMSSEEKCVNAQIDGWNATDPNSYGTKYIDGKSYSKKELYLAYAWRQCKEK
jgi:hypothetical protein